MHGRFCKFGRPRSPSATPERKKRQREAPEDRCIVCSASTLSGGKPMLDVLLCDGGDCDNEVHFACSGLVEMPADLTPFFCSSCAPPSPARPSTFALVVTGGDDAALPTTRPCVNPASMRPFVRRPSPPQPKWSSPQRDSPPPQRDSPQLDSPQRNSPPQCDSPQLDLHQLDSPRDSSPSCDSPPQDDLPQPALDSSQDDPLVVTALDASRDEVEPAWTQREWNEAYLHLSDVGWEWFHGPHNRATGLGSAIYFRPDVLGVGEAPSSNCGHTFLKAYVCGQDYFDSASAVLESVTASSGKSDFWATLT